MYGPNKMYLWVLTGVLAVTTVFFNAYIVLMSARSYRLKGKLSPSETIMVALAAANVSHQLLCYAWMTMDEADGECRINRPYTVILLCVFGLKFTIMWDTGFLTFYYSTKLVTTPNQCYMHIQAAILKHVRVAVLLIPLCGLGTCIPMLAVFQAANATTSSSSHMDCGVLMPDTVPGKAYEAVYLLLADVLPGVLMMKCCISISIHLGIHLRNMKASTNGAHAPKLGSQMRVIQMALSLVAVFVLFLVVDLYVNYQIAVHHENIITLTFFFTSLYTTAAAMVLIYGKKTFWKPLLADFNATLDEYPCLSGLKVSEQQTKGSAKVPHVKT